MWIFVIVTVDKLENFIQNIQTFVFWIINKHEYSGI